MPSPLGHSLAGIAAGWAIGGPADSTRGRWRQAAVFAGVAIAPDLDLLIHRHSAETHSLGAAVIVASLVTWALPGLTRARWLTWCAVAVAYSTHPLLDAMAPDASPPLGVMAFWPFSSSHVLTGWNVFQPIWRECCRTRIIQHNLFAMATELTLLLPLVFAARPRRS